MKISSWLWSSYIKTARLGREVCVLGYNSSGLFPGRSPETNMPKSSTTAIIPGLSGD